MVSDSSSMVLFCIMDSPYQPYSGPCWYLI
jgi:hypothetical protein